MLYTKTWKYNLKRKITEQCIHTWFNIDTKRFVTSALKTLSHRLNHKKNRIKQNSPSSNWLKYKKYQNKTHLTLIELKTS